MTNKNAKTVKIKENKLVDLINDIVEKTIAERRLVPAPAKKVSKPKKFTVTESQLRELQAKGAKINSIVKKRLVEGSDAQAIQAADYITKLSNQPQDPISNQPWDSTVAELLRSVSQWLHGGATKEQVYNSLKKDERFTDEVYNNSTLKYHLNNVFKAVGDESQGYKAR